MEGISFQNTSISTRIMFTLDYCYAMGSIGCIYGDAGIGKTITIKEWSKDKSNVIVLLASRAYKSEKSFLKLISRSIHARTSGCIDDIFTSVIEQLKQMNLTIVIDEAQRLPINTLEDIRDINELTGTGIILVGNENIYKRMVGSQQSEFAQLFSRISMRMPLLTDYFQLEDINKVFGELAPEVSEYLLSIARSKYGLRGAVNVYLNALNAEKTTDKGLKAMAKQMGVAI
jgi:hypothetical protein